MSQTDWNQLRELACERRDTLGLRLAEAATVRDAARQKLEMLLDYRNEYDSRLSQSAIDGIDAEKLRNYRTFSPTSRARSNSRPRPSPRQTRRPRTQALGPANNGRSTLPHPQPRQKAPPGGPRAHRKNPPKNPGPR